VRHPGRRLRSALCRQAGRDEGMSTSVEQRDDADSCRRWLPAIRIEHRLSLQEDTCHLQESVRDATEGAAMGMTALAQSSVATAALGVALDGCPRPMKDRVA